MHIDLARELHKKCHCYKLLRIIPVEDGTADGLFDIVES